jgi:hypothetical protein
LDLLQESYRQDINYFNTPCLGYETADGLDWVAGFCCDVSGALGYYFFGAGVSEGFVTPPKTYYLKEETSAGFFVTTTTGVPSCTIP